MGLIGLFTLFFGGPTGAFLTERHTGVRLIPLFTYYMWCLVIIGVVVAMNRAKKNRNGWTAYAFDRSTKMIGKVVLIALVIFLVLFILIGLTDNLPQQSKLPMRVTRVEVLRDKTLSDVAGLELFSPFLKGLFPNGVLEEARFHVAIDKDITKDWHLEQAQIYPVFPSGKIDTELVQNAEVQKGPTDSDITLSFISLPEMNRGRLRLILLANRDKVKISKNEAEQESDPEKKKEKLHSICSQWEEKAKATKQQLDMQGSVTITPEP
jgi:hypothetical protein